MKLVKLSSGHYIIVDENKQPVEGYYYDNFIKDIRDTRGAEYGQADHCWQITHSTQPLEQGYGCEIKEGLMLRNVGKELCYDLIKPLSLSEVKELLGEVDVEKKATDYANTFIGEESTADVDYKAGYIAALEDNKDRKYTEKDMRKAYYKGATDCHDKCTERNWRGIELKVRVDSLIDLCSTYIQSLQPPTSWDVEFVDGKLKLV